MPITRLITVSLETTMAAQDVMSFFLVSTFPEFALGKLHSIYCGRGSMPCTCSPVIDSLGSGGRQIAAGAGTWPVARRRKVGFQFYNSLFLCFAFQGTLTCFAFLNLEYRI